MSTALRTVCAEWTKLRTTPGPVWLLLITATVTVALGAAVAAAASCPHDGCGIDAARLVLSGVYLGQAPVAVLAVLAVSGEYSTTLIRTTLTAVPSRPAVLAAKALVLGAAVAAIGSLAVLGSLVVAGIVLPRHGFTPGHGYPGLSLADGPVLRASAGTVAYLVLVAILSLGVAAVVRDSGASIGTVLGLLYLPPLVTQMVTDPDLHRRLEQLAPMSAGLAVQATTDLHQLPIGPWAGLGVLAAWSAGALLTGTALLRHRDT
ncbi:ABC transporter permease [Dactylosporangium sp. AC04546]|uniref:ABC transporter permease n=1 Tax=Dactylosporangium sp. AC04546 TaxID=2862460 RepID=UPI001EDCC5A9|nr:ABC transporter permease [Dactylosporangium sp. AC04546]WVK79220.1 ABC transporter permease [Dactylosporangium sp. AC04546]